RRLAAILAADVAGYSRLMGIDEEGTHKDLKAHCHELVEPKIQKHRGRMIKNTGDGFLAEFTSVLDAVRCATEIQQGMILRNAKTPDERRIEFRIGVHQGDIIIDSGDIFGDGVNVAARLEGIADPGGICVSARVQEDVRGKLDLALDDIGEQRLKNIERPVRVYRILSENKATRPRPALALPDRPSIAVLPFQNMSGDPEQDYFADGVVEELITALSRFRQLFVIARNSSFTYKDRAADVKQVGRELGVRYVLEGSVRRAANRVRITAQLIDAQTGGHLWANRFDGTPEDIFDLQDQVTTSVVGAIIPKLEEVEFNRSKFKPTESLDAYDYYLRAMMYFNQWTDETIGKALDLFYKAIELDPEFASANGLAAWCYVRRKLSGWMKNPGEMAELERLARRAIKLANDDAVALYSGGWALVQVAGSVEEGAAALNRALTLNPNMTSAWLLSGWTKIYIGEPDEAIEHLVHAMRLNPLDPLFQRMQTGVAAAHFLAGRYEQSSSYAHTALQQHPNYLPLLRVAAASHALAGKMIEAEKAVAQICRQDPTSRLSSVTQFAPFRRPEDISRYQDGLHKAGLPE
ncbi:MAG: adenylate/guanylate cyclase domain-containing protein, partial [Pseudolabrys sp.]